MIINPETLASERAYYLPPAKSGLETSWKKYLSRSQEVFADLSQRGHDIVADQITLGMKDGHLPTITELYQTASHIRRAIAVINQSGKMDYQLYGHPLCQSAFVQMKDKIENDPDTRYAEHFPKVESNFLRMLEWVKADTFEEHFGDKYCAEWREDTKQISIYVFDLSLKAYVSHIEWFRDSSQINLYQAMLKDQAKLLDRADIHFQDIMDGAYKDKSIFSAKMDDIRRDVFQAAPIRLGYQATALMLMAGIAKAAGYKVEPIECEADHFIDVAFTPYKKRVLCYEKNPALADGQLPQLNFNADASFLDIARDKTRARYAYGTPESRMRRYFKDRGSEFDITDVTVENGKIASVKVADPSQQGLIDHAIKFIGPDKMADALGLSHTPARNPLAEGWKKIVANMGQGIRRY
jgi:hypothetical protein